MPDSRLPEGRGGGSQARLLETASSQVRRMTEVEVAGIEPVRTVWNHREPLVTRSNLRKARRPMALRLNGALTPSTRARLYADATRLG